jgi:DNA-binding NarL/FixJ family response regulator
MTGRVLWTPPADVLDKTRIGHYLAWLRAERGLSFAGYPDLYDWSVRDLPAFWRSIWDYFEVIAHTEPIATLPVAEMPGATWFPGATLNYAEHVLRMPGLADGDAAVLAYGQTREPVTLTARQLRDEVRVAVPDVVIVDIRLPPTHTDEGLRAAIELRAAHPGLAVLVLSQYVEVGLAMTLLADSADGVGYLLKDRISDVPEFIAAVRRVAAGGSALDPEVVGRLIGVHRTGDPLATLTAREREVLRLVAEGLTDDQIAGLLVLSPHTVHRHVSNIRLKLDAPSRAAAAAAATRQGLI